jgi:hypothetical protein
MFERYIGVDYSGAGLPTQPLSGLRIFQAEIASEPAPVAGPLKYQWSRKNLASWLSERCRDSTPTLIGIDHCFSFPQSFISQLQQPEITSWDEVLRYADETWKSRTLKVADALRSRLLLEPWMLSALRETEKHTSSAKSVFNFTGPGVAHSSFAGLPWLCDLRDLFRGQVHFWPFDGWEVPAGQSCIVEVYPSLFSRRFAKQEHPGGAHAHDAYSVCRWMCDTDALGHLETFFSPPLPAETKATARLEGWILGVM